MKALRVGVIGYGYWGPNLARNFNELSTSELVVIADQKEEQLKRARPKYPEIEYVVINTGREKARRKK